MGYTFGPKGFSRGLQGFLLQINIAEIVIHKTDQPDSILDFLHANGLAGERYAEVDLLVVQAKATAAGDHDGAIVERIVGLGDAAIGARGSRIDLGWAFHGQGLMRPFLVELLQEGVEFGLLLQDVGTRGASGFFLQSQMHALVAAVLLGMAGADALNGDA